MTYRELLVSHLMNTLGIKHGKVLFGYYYSWNGVMDDCDDMIFLDLIATRAVNWMKP